MRIWQLKGDYISLHVWLNSFPLLNISNGVPCPVSFSSTSSFFSLFFYEANAFYFYRALLFCIIWESILRSKIRATTCLSDRKLFYLISQEYESILYSFSVWYKDLFHLLLFFPPALSCPIKNPSFLSLMTGWTLVREFNMLVASGWFF